jgi:hypothetical protein
MPTETARSIPQLIDPDATPGTPRAADTAREALGLLTASQTQGETTVFNPDGSITQTSGDGQVVATTFNADGSITETFASPIGKTRTTTFNADGSIGVEIT